MGTGSFPGLKRPGRGVDHQPPSSAEVNEVVELYLYALCAFLVCYRVNFVCDKLNLLNWMWDAVAVNPLNTELNPICQ